MKHDDLFDIIESRDILVDGTCNQGACNGK